MVESRMIISKDDPLYEYKGGDEYNVFFFFTVYKMEKLNFLTILVALKRAVLNDG